MKLFLAAAALVVAAAPALAQEIDHSTMDHSATGSAQSGEASPSTQAFEAANAKMHEDMAVELTGDADVDFVRSMIPHHQGAIDMAKIVLQYGDDPELAALAEEIVSAQETEIAQMRDWLARNGHAD
ncbi:CopM family metallochaperone [Aureimonas mangrovi]|uniref:CopM family metallochaperone n=1 Tax=Aureimonas mangrovi TaxID=2758041 RepID=UPI001FE64899|nr:DUF305 domain-containing protein [Aureimonas mangrovi]